MNDNDKTTNESGVNNPSNVTDFIKYKENGPTQLGQPLDEKKPWPTAEQPKDPPGGEPKERKLIVTTTDGERTISGFVGLTNSFLAIGDKTGAVKYAVAGGIWKTVEDVTDQVENVQ